MIRKIFDYIPEHDRGMVACVVLAVVLLWGFMGMVVVSNVVKYYFPVACCSENRCGTD